MCTIKALLSNALSTHYANAIIQRTLSSREAAYVLKDKGRQKVSSMKGLLWCLAAAPPTTSIYHACCRLSRAAVDVQTYAPKTKAVKRSGLIGMDATLLGCLFKTKCLCA